MDGLEQIQMYMTDIPIPKVYYSVSVKYDQNVEEAKDLNDSHSDPIDTYLNATQLARKLADQISTNIGCAPMELAPEENVLGEYYYIVTDMEEVAATVMITAYDYKSVKIN